MTKLKIFTLILISFVLVSCNGQNKGKNNALNTVSKIEVIDFHSTNRCMTCNAIESSTKYTLDTYFTDEVKNGKITFLVINVDKKENEALAEKFEAYGTSLFLNVIKNGKETKLNLTEFAFMKGNDQDAFSKDLKAKIEVELKTL